MRDKSVIPFGLYCYTFLELPDKKNRYHGKIQNCPYYKHKTINNVKVPWCTYLGLGGIDNGWTSEEWKSVKKHYKNEKELDKNLPFSLLWDACKECGENMEE